MACFITYEIIIRKTRLLAVVEELVRLDPTLIDRILSAGASSRRAVNREAQLSVSIIDFTLVRRLIRSVMSVAKQRAEQRPIRGYTED